MRNLPALTAALTPLFQRCSVAEWVRRLGEFVVPAGPVLEIAQMHADPQTLARKMIVETEHPIAGKVKSIGLPIKFSGTPGSVRRAAPLLGQHTREVLREHGFTNRQIKQMAQEGAIQFPASNKKGTKR